MRPTEIVVPLDYEHDPESGLNRGRGHVVVPIEYDADLPVLGERRVNAFGPCPIVLREWNEQVLLHELLHLILGTPGATPADPHGHRTIGRVEVALWESGWRCRPDAGRYIVGYFCHKGSGHFEMYHDPDAEMACGSSLAPIYLDAEDAEWFRSHDLLPPGRWENETCVLPPG